MGKQKLMFEYLDLLDADSFYFCFTDLERHYLNFLDRTKQRVVDFANTPENLNLAERLQAVEYITSHKVNEKSI